MEKLILVIGATGNQGGAVARHLLPAGFKVRAFTRDPEGKKAGPLVREGVELFKGDLDDEARLFKAMTGVQGVFCAINMRDGGVQAEEERGKRMADMAQQAGVPHLVYSSVGGAERNSGLAHFESKWRIEEHIRSLGLPATILRPVAFMENFLLGPPSIFLTFMRSFLGESKLQMVSVEDIGAWATVAFLEPNKLMGKAVEIAGDELNYREVGDLYYKVTGKHPWTLGLPAPLAAKLLGEFGRMFTWFKEHGYQADVAECRRTLHHSVSFEEFLLTKVEMPRAKAA